MHHWVNVFSSTANFVRFKSHKHKIGKKLPGLIAQILLTGFVPLYPEKTKKKRLLRGSGSDMGCPRNQVWDASRRTGSFGWLNECVA